MFRWYLFGCVTVAADGDFTFKAAPEGTWFDGNSKAMLSPSNPDGNWVEAMTKSGGEGGCEAEEVWRRAEF